MADEITETTEQNPVAAETTAEQTPPVETETPKEQTKETYSERERRLYARVKEAEEVKKKYATELAQTKEALAKAKLPISDIDAILEVQSSTRDLDSDEVGELKLRASAMGVGLNEARQNKNFQIWQRGHREEVQKQKALAPNTNQSEIEKPKTLQEKLAAARTLEDKGKILSEVGMNPMTIRDYHSF